VIDKIKEVIKAKPKQYSVSQKLNALKLLNRIIIKNNKLLNACVEKKLMDRLSLIASMNVSKKQNSFDDIVERGKIIFGPDE